MTLSKSILIIEQDPGVQQMIVAALTGLSLSFHSCTDGNDGFSEMTSESFDAVILNYPVAGVESNDFFIRLNQEAIKYPPIIVIADDTNHHLQESMIQNGADYYLSKPFNMSFLKYVVKEALKIEDVTDESLSDVIDVCKQEERSAMIWVKTPNGQGVINIEKHHLASVAYNGYTSEKALKLLSQANHFKVERVWKQ